MGEFDQALNDYSRVRELIQAGHATGPDQHCRSSSRLLQTKEEGGIKLMY